MTDPDSLAVRIPEGLNAFLGTVPAAPPKTTGWRVDLSRPGAFRPKGVEPNPTPSKAASAPKPVPAAAPPVREPGARRTTGRLDQLLKHSERQLNKKLGIPVPPEDDSPG